MLGQPAEATRVFGDLEMSTVGIFRNRSKCHSPPPFFSLRQSFSSGWPMNQYAIQATLE